LALVENAAGAAMSNSSKIKLRAVLGDYPHAKAIKHGQISRDRIELAFEHYSPTNSAFKLMARGFKFALAQFNEELSSTPAFERHQRAPSIASQSAGSAGLRQRLARRFHSIVDLARRLLLHRAEAPACGKGNATERRQPRELESRIDAIANAYVEDRHSQGGASEKTLAC
jgi:hypothetical protein